MNEALLHFCEAMLRRVPEELRGLPMKLVDDGPTEIVRKDGALVLTKTVRLEPDFPEIGEERKDHDRI